MLRSQYMRHCRATALMHALTLPLPAKHGVKGVLPPPREGCLKRRTRPALRAGGRGVVGELAGLQQRGHGADDRQ